MSARVDVSALIGPYPFRELPHPDAPTLLTVLDREEIERAWVGYLPSAFHREPGQGNARLVRELEPYRSRLTPAPAVRPDWPDWPRELARAADAGAAAIRAYPSQWSMAPGSAAMRELASACAERSLPLLLTVRFEDARQRQAIDVAGDLPASTVRELARGTACAIVVVAAGRAFVEEVHWGLTALEQQRVYYDTSWIWGPPEDDLAHLLRTIGAERFVYGSGWPLRLAQVARANLALLPEDLLGIRLAEPPGR